MNMEKVSKSFGPFAPQQVPLLAFSHGRHMNIQSFFSIVEGRSYEENIAEMSGKTCLTFAHGWLLVMEKKTKDYSLLNIKTLEVIHLPPLLLPDSEFPSDKYESFISSEPTKGNCVVFFIAWYDPIIMFCRLSENKWSKIHYKLDEEGGLRNIVSCKGKLYGHTFENRLAVLDFDPDPVASLVGLPPLVALSVNQCLMNMVESDGEIFYVLRDLLRYTDIVTGVYVFKADLVEKKWVQVQSIGDRVFFLCQGHSVSCSAMESGIKGGSIYYVLPEDPCLYRYDIADRSITMDQPFPKLNKPWFAPHWIFI